MKKLIRNKIIEKLKEDEYEFIEDQNELNKLYILKIKEELEEIIMSDFKDPLEFADLIEVAYAFAEQNEFTPMEINSLRGQKFFLKGEFKNIALKNIPKDHPSNKIYFNE